MCSAQEVKRDTAMPKRYKVREIIKMVEAAGWEYIGSKGSHRQFKHPDKPGKVTIAGHPNDDVHPAILKSILDQAGLEL
jgi:predicted RNA binding protein YcfA (HicA-like mRNA interferase family)